MSDSCSMDFGKQPTLANQPAAESIFGQGHFTARDASPNSGSDGADPAFGRVPARGLREQHRRRHDRVAALRSYVAPSARTGRGGHLWRHSKAWCARSWAREYIRGIYWAHLPGYDTQNAFAPHTPLSHWFWSDGTRTNAGNQ